MADQLLHPSLPFCSFFPHHSCDPETLIIYDAAERYFHPLPFSSISLSPLIWTVGGCSTLSAPRITRVAPYFVAACSSIVSLVTADDNIRTEPSTPHAGERLPHQPLVSTVTWKVTPHATGSLLSSWDLHLRWLRPALPGVRKHKREGGSFFYLCFFPALLYLVYCRQAS